MNIFLMSNNRWARHIKNNVSGVTLCCNSCCDHCPNNPDVLVFDMDTPNIESCVQQCRLKYPQKPIVVFGHSPTKAEIRHLFFDLHVDEVADKTENPVQLINVLSSAIYRKERRDHLEL